MVSKMKNADTEKNKRKYFRKCGCCGDSHEQHEMHRTDQSISISGWLCEECYEELHLEHDIEEEW